MNRNRDTTLRPLSCSPSTNNNEMKNKNIMMLIEVDVESLRAAMDRVKTGRRDPNYDPNMAMDGLLDLLTDIVEADVVVDNAAELRTEVTNLAATNTTLRAEGANLLAEVTSLRTTNAALAASVNTLTAAGPALGAPN